MSLQQLSNCNLRSPQHPRPQHVCSHKEESQEQMCRRAFDVDSHLGFLCSSAVCREDLWHLSTPQVHQNITKDVHLQTQAFVAQDDPERAPRSRLTMLRDVPHFLLGRTAGAHDVTIHVLFLHLPKTQDNFVSLTKDQHTRWLDRIFYPAVYRHCEAHITQYLPASFRHVYGNSKARQVEARKIETASYQAQQSLGFHIQTEYLDRIWTDILNTVGNEPGLGDFREPQLFFQAFGSKLQFKSGPTRPGLFETIEFFRSYLDKVFDPQFVDWQRTYVDLAFELCPVTSHLAVQDLHIDEEPQVLLWKRRCLERIVRNLYDSEPPSIHTAGQRYLEENMLYEAATVNSIPLQRCRLYKGGVRHLQLYNSVKEVWDAAKTKPFDNDGLEEMALDPQIRQAARQLAGGHRRDAAVLERAYCSSKKRAREGLRDSQQKSFGIRGEFRISWALLEALMNLLELEPREVDQIERHDAPPYTWVVRTETYLNFLWRSLDKFAGLFETIRGTVSTGVGHLGADEDDGDGTAMSSVCTRRTWTQTRVSIMVELVGASSGHPSSIANLVRFRFFEYPPKIWILLDGAADRLGEESV